MSQTTGTAFAHWLEEDEPDDEEVQSRPPWWRRPALIATVVVLVIVLIGAGLFARSQFLTSKPVQYQSANVTTGNLTVQVSANGPIGSAASYNLNFPASGKLIEVDVQVGQQVQAGQLLAKIDSTSLNDSVNQSKASLNSAWINYDNAVKNLSDVQAQNNPCPTPKTQDSCTQSIDQAQAQVNSAWGQVQVSQAQLQTAQDNAQNATMTAPAAGTIIAVNGTVGTVVGGGNSSSSSSAFIVLEDLSQLSITAQVNEADIGGVKVGQSARFTVPAYPSSTFHGTVTAISPLGQTTSSVVTYNVTISVDAHSLNGISLLPGMTASLEITTQERIGVLLVPNKAITFARTLLAGGQLDRTQVRTLLANALQNAGTQTPQGTPSFIAEQQNGKLVPKIIFTGLTDGTNTEVLSGLQDSEQVLTGQVGATSTPATGTGGGGLGGGGIFGGGGGGGGGGRGGGGGGGGG